MTYRHACVSSCPRSALFTRKPSWQKLILAGAILPAGLILAPSSEAADVILPNAQNPYIINSDVGTAIYKEGLLEGFINASDDESTVNPANSTPELTLRMAQDTTFGTDGWANPRTWIYTGQINTGPNGILSFAFNNDDTDWLKINGTVVLNDNGWDTAVAGVVTGLAPNTWVEFEYRVSDTGAGGAGPSGQNVDPANPGSRPLDQLNWNNTTGAVMSWENEANSNNAANYIGGMNDLGKPTEVGDGNATLFRYFAGNGFTDNFKLQGDASILLNGASTVVSEPSMRFENAAPATLTVNDGADTGGLVVHKTLEFINGTSFTAANQSVTITGSSDVRVGRLTSGGFTGLTLTADGTGQVAPGQLIIDHVDAATPNDLSGIKLQAGPNGRLTIAGNLGVNPIATLTQPVTISGDNGVVNIGVVAGAQTFDNAIQVNANGILEHNKGGNTTIGGATNGVTIADTKTLTANVSAGSLTIAGPVNGAASTLTKIGTNTLTVSGTANLGTINVTEGPLVFSNTLTAGQVTLDDQQNFVGGTLTTSGQTTISALNSTVGTANFNGQTTITTSTVTGGTVRFGGQANITTSNVSGTGAVTFAGTTTVGASNVTGGTVTFAGPTTLTGATTISNGGRVTLTSTSGNNITGAINVNGGGIFQVIPGSFNGNTVNLNGGTLTLSGGSGGTTLINGFVNEAAQPSYRFNSNGTNPLPTITDGTLKITVPANDYIGSAYNLNKQDITKFVASFTYQEFGNATGNLTDVADGAAFVIQNSGLGALGGGGGGLGYSGVNNSAAFLLNIWGGARGGPGQQFSTTGQTPGTNTGLLPYNPTPGINLRSGNPISITLAYDGNNVNVKMTDTVTGGSFTTTYENIDIPSLVGGKTAFIGFSGATGGSNADQRFSNFQFQSASVAETYGVNVNVAAGAPSTINAFSLGQRANLGTLTMANGGNLQVAGNTNVAFTTSNFAAANGSYTFGGDQGEINLGNYSFTGAGSPTITKTGASTLVVESTGTNTLPAGTVLNLEGGKLSALAQSGNPSPLGNATINMNGGGVDLSSKGGNLTFGNAFTLGTSGSISAGFASGAVTTPVTVTLSNPLNLPTGKTLNLSSAKQHSLVLNSTAPTAAGGTVNIEGGTVTAAGASINGLNLSLNAASGPATLNLPDGATVTSLSGAAKGAIVLGNGSGTQTLVVNQSVDTTYAGAINAATGSTVGLTKSGTGTLALTGTGSNINGGVTVTQGVLNIESSNAIGTGALNLAGGTVRVAPAGLEVFHYDNDSGAEAAFQMTQADLDFAVGREAIYQRYTNFFAQRTATDFGTSIRTTAGGNTGLQFNGTDGAPFGVLGIPDTDNMAVRMTGYINIPAAGSIRFLTNSDDGSVVFINGVPVVNNNRYQGMGVDNTRGSGTPGNPALPQPSTPTLAAGQHKIDIGFYEGTGGAGIIILYRPVGSTTDIVIPNSVLGGFHGENPVNVSADSTLDLQGSTSRFGTLTLNGGTTLSVNSGDVTFTGTSLPTDNGIYNIAKASGTIVLGNIDSGNRVVTLNKTGDGTLVLNETTAPQFQNAGSKININGGALGVVLASTGTSPLGNAQLLLNGGNLFLGSKSQGSAVILTNAFSINQDATIAAGNFGGGAVNGQEAQLQSLDVPAGRTLTLRSQDNYTLRVNGAVTGAANSTIKVTGGNVVANSTTTVSSLQINGGTFNARGNVNVSGGVTVDPNATFAIGSTAAPNVTYAGGVVSVNGGVLAARGGVADFSNANVTFAPVVTTETANSLKGSFYTNYVNPGGGFGSQQGTAETLTRTPNYTAQVDSNRLDGINFGPVSAGDQAIADFFTAPVGDANVFTAAFNGKFTATENGLHEFGFALNDDGAAFWIDLNQNGIFELAGSAGSERLALGGCCGNADPAIDTRGSATLIQGQSYNTLLVVQDTGGGGSIAGRFKTPSMAEVAFINPGDPTQQGLWTGVSSSGGGRLRVEGGAELKMGTFTGASDISFTGNNSRLTLGNSATPVVSTATTVRTELGVNQTAFLNIGQNNTLEVANLSVSNDGVVLAKTGTGTVIANNQSIGLNALLRVDDGLMVLKGKAGAFNGATAGTGGAQVNGGTLQIAEGAELRGGVTVNIGGRLNGLGKVASLTSAGGTIEPGIGVGTLTTGNLTFNGGTLELEISSATLFDQLIASGTVNILANTALSLSLGNFDPSDNGTMTFKIVDNIGTQAVATTGFFTHNNQPLGNFSLFTVGTQQFLINYAGGDGNDIVLTAVPEPTTAVTLLGALGTLVGVQRFRRRRA